MRIRRAKYEAMRAEIAETARLRRELAAQMRVNDRLSDQLMDAMGYTEAGRQLLDAVRPAAPKSKPSEVSA